MAGAVFMGEAAFTEVAGASTEVVDFAAAGFTEAVDSERGVAFTEALREDIRDRMPGRTKDPADSKAAPSADMHVETSTGRVQRE